MGDDAGILGGGAGNGCMFARDPNKDAIEGININGNATINAPNCGIVDNGNFNTKGNALNVTAGTFSVTGSWSGGGGTVTCTYSATCPALATPAAADPLAYLTPPCTNCSGGSSSNGSGTVNPGTYSSITVGPGNTVFSPGLYIIDGAGGLTIGANATVTGTGGVTFYFTNGATITVNGTPSVQLSAPNSGNYAGILFIRTPRMPLAPRSEAIARASIRARFIFQASSSRFLGTAHLMAERLIPSLTQPPLR